MGLFEVDAGLGAALELVRQGCQAEAEAALAPLADRHPAAAALLTGALAARRGDLERALSETGRAVQLALADGAALAALAAVQLALERPRFAVPPAARAARLGAEIAAGHAALAAAEQRLDRPDQAIAAIRRAAVAAALANGKSADTPGFRAVAAGLAERLTKAERQAEAPRFRAAAKGAAPED